MKLQNVQFENWGLVPYLEARERQQRLLDEIVAFKRNGQTEFIRHRLIVCAHPPVFTIGKSGSMDHLLITHQQAEEESIEIHQTNRGGDITFHGPGQLVVYPILDLDQLFTDVHRYIRSLEEVIIRVMADYRLQGKRIAAYTGVWLQSGTDEWRKICAIGVHLSRWVTMHGLAFNISTTLDYFDKIIPCGIQEEGKGVTSLERELARAIDREEVIRKFITHFEEVFEVSIIYGKEIKTG
ncbi:MAG: lipoyl(octanoyl) transferase LipB [Saprospiraceae bacterium]|nr:lipoyl(octanoyl) transferase LipB [Saprospiraceae bacterium]